MATSDIQAICSQLLTPDDLAVSDELFDQVLKENIVTQILNTKKSKYVKIFSNEKLFLSHITPLLHNIGFEIIDEVTYNVSNNKEEIYISRFNLNVHDENRLEEAKSNLEYIITNTLKDASVKHSKAFSLVYTQNLTLRKIMLLRAFIEYIDQAVLTINSATILNTLTTHDSLACLFVKYFITKFQPEIKNRKSELDEIEKNIKAKIKIIPQIIDDRILNLTLLFLKSLLRTNYFLNKETISFKIDTKTFGKDLKGLQPNLENFIYHPDFYGVHLRMSKVSRGGLRWSDRHDDYRQEVKSLMITQEGKNSIIIPDGSKGGFVINKENSEVTKELFTYIYSEFINANLDLVDNMKDGNIERNENIVAYDGEDPYFVVAADKGTAAMSDIANNIAISRNYWLGDAFASGGSNGYGHKDLGITARGAIMSSKRFFIEDGVDIYKDEVSVVGIGSMSGDVFGNGLIESEKFKLVAAISHKDIFIDPTPDIKKSYIERKKLFESKSGGWTNYDKKVISKGGGVFKRNDKEIELSAEIKKLLGTTKKIISGEELCRRLLTLDVDMLFNGGVGTYVKASDENNLDLGDKQNEAVRVDANEIKARIICEGGNLGFTQRARIEYALNGGRIHLDGIDNAAGVNTSDHEVNLKILLNSIKAQGILSEKQVKETLDSLTEQVVDMVLQSNYDQAYVISIDEQFSRRYPNDYIKSIEVLENNIEAFNRRDFYIPKNENMNEIIDIHGSIVRPVLGSLLSYCKIFVKKILFESTLIDDQFSQQYLTRYFPKSFVGAYEFEISSHPLKKEIISTVMADMIINHQGVTFISDFERLGLERFLLKIKSYLIVKQLFGARTIRQKIYDQDYVMPIEKQYKLVNKLEYTLYASTRWMVKYLKKNQLDSAHILDHQEELFQLLSEVHNQKVESLIPNDESFNQFFSVIDYLRFAIAAIIIKEDTHHSFKDVIVLFYSLIHEFNILEIVLALNKVKITNPSDMTLRNQVLQFIEFIVVHYTKKILDFQRINEEPDVAFANFITNEKETFYKVREQLDSFMVKDVKDIKEIAITVNQLMVSLI
ncbi:NAD-glutamate dehydrogenase domain-containing protein [Poseidonibacter lekithochrous]|uniref:NAD-glutamate dehydrogenase domain-containing protein n=1 Tax=Poseidonibacter lekithochrous TaxID=1904463 RepID=UPI0008FC3124|nr:NAD-glutamate dehydrogenase domain-containing protein [Poseidonibacter lekithochrous]QKJ22459.1 NAD-specific glutamate dehydrogenase [Poseidonibacter lekithochrous]